MGGGAGRPKRLFFLFFFGFFNGFLVLGDWGLARPASLAWLARGLGFWHLGPGSWLGWPGSLRWACRQGLRRAFRAFW